MYRTKHWHRWVPHTSSAVSAAHTSTGTMQRPGQCHLRESHWTAQPVWRLTKPWCWRTDACCFTDEMFQYCIFPLSTGHYYCFSFVACARLKKRTGGNKKKHVFPRLQFLPIKRTFFKSYSYIQNTIYPALKVEAFSPVEEKNLKDHQAYSFFRTPLAVFNTTAL